MKARSESLPRWGSMETVMRQAVKKPIKSLMGTITHVEANAPVAALSFDDGPHETFTPELLDVLEKHGALATFFMVGDAALQFPELVKKVYQAGHAIGNHTFNHKALPELGPWREIGEILKCQRAVKPYGTRLLRPPWGRQTLVTRLIALILGYKVITWNLTAEDWDQHSSEWMADQLASKLRPGSIILLHDRIFASIFENPQYDRTATIEAIDLFLQRTTEVFKFVTIPQLLRYGKPHFVIWKQSRKTK